MILANSSQEQLVLFLKKIPGINSWVSSGVYKNGLWWIKFKIDIDHSLAWRIVQEFGNLLNYISINETLACVFKPVSPPVYLNGGPKEYLAWIIESTDISFTPEVCLNWLETRLPQPVDNLNSWKLDDEA